MASVRDELLVGLALGLTAASGCFTARVDPDLAGVFVCGDDENDGTCPSSLVCVNDRCEDADLVPEILIAGPEDEEVLVRPEAIDLGIGAGGMGPMPGMVEVSVRIRGALQLVSASAGADPTFGEGHVRISIDGGEPVTIDTGSINMPQTVTMMASGVAGAHRIVAQAFRNDGEPYDNPEATATRLFWVTSVPLDQITRPFVAIKSPWPGSVFTVDDQTIDVELATLRFDLVAPGEPPAERSGHAHLYYDERVRYPECAFDEGCRESYLELADGPPDELELPTAMESGAVITAALANGDHSLYGFPFPCDFTTQLPCVPVFDAVDIVRVEEDEE